MNEEQKPGAAMHDDDPEARRQAAAMMGRARTPAKIAAGRANAAKAAAAVRGTRISEEHKQRIRESALARAAAKAEVAGPKPPPGKRGRPAKPKSENPEPARPRGRPKKTETPTNPA